MKIIRDVIEEEFNKPSNREFVVHTWNAKAIEEFDKAIKEDYHKKIR